jgi:peroxiredoxin
LSGRDSTNPPGNGWTFVAEPVTAMNIAVVFAWIALLLLCCSCWQLLRQNGGVLLRLEALEQRLDELEFGGPAAPEGLPVGRVAPEFDLTDLTGERRALAQFRAQPLLLVFFNPDCGYCRDLAPKLAALAKRSEVSGQRSDDQSHVTSATANGHPLVLVITTGDAEKNRRFFREHKITSPVLLQEDSEVATAYQANGTPTGYLIDAEGRIASELAAGAEALLALAGGKAESRNQKVETNESVLGPRQTIAGNEYVRANRFHERSLARSRIARNGLKAGTPAPLFRLPRLDGGELALEDLRGNRVLLVFSDPHCGPCEALAPQLEQLHREHPELRVVMISRGEPRENRTKVKEHGLTFPVVLQQHWEISRRYAMFATPIAYLIDEAGVIAHDVAVGEDAIRKLLTQAKASVAVT